MEFSAVAADTAKNVGETINYILGLNISLEDKRLRVAKVLRLVGDGFFGQLFDANSQVFDSGAIASLGIQDQSQAGRLANKIIRNTALGRETTTLVAGYYDSLLGQAQDEAFKNAKSMQKNPRVVRNLVGETCKWCAALAGSYENPPGEVFARHSDCDCLIQVSGYNTRNGVLNNYVKRRPPR